jgi:hypothetical protein
VNSATAWRTEDGSNEDIRWIRFGLNRSTRGLLADSPGSRTRTARGPGHDSGLCADADSARPRLCHGLFVVADWPLPRPLGQSLRGHRAPFLRLVRGRQKLPAGRGNACPLQRAMSETLPPPLLRVALAAVRLAKAYRDSIEQAAIRRLQ